MVFLKNICYVLQEGRLFQGDILLFILVFHHHFDLERYWENVALVHVDKGMKDMLMKINTMILEEGVCAVSGKQNQLILIALALVGKEKLFIFYEAAF
ncbi:MAG: hypothetical protein HUJ51_02740 [Eggerthellaceae bacterium]|nr:hypothetical protein [Eggerthellaceae bacterium]